MEKGVYGCYDRDNKQLFTVSLKETEQFIILYDCLGNGFFQPVEIEEQFFREKIQVKLRKDNKNNHCIKIWSDKDFTVYFNRSGIPYYFKKLNEKEIENIFKRNYENDIEE